MKTLVTGGAGFIGSHICDALLAEGHEVLALDDLSTGQLSNLSEKVNFTKGDIRDEDLLLNLTKDCDVIFHEAAIANIPFSLENPKLVNDVNVNGTLNVLEAARKNDVKRVVFASSSSVYGNAKSPIAETAPLDPKTPYAVTKLIGEHYLRLYFEFHKINCVALRYFNVYGPRQLPGPAISAFISKAIANQPMIIYGDGLQTRDFVYVGDVAYANLAALNTQSGFFSLNVGTSHSTSILDIAKTISEVENIKIEFKDARSADAKESLADISYVTKTLDWTPKTSFKEGLEKTIAYFKSK